MEALIIYYCVFTSVIFALGLWVIILDIWNMKYWTCYKRNEIIIDIAALLKDFKMFVFLIRTLPFRLKHRIVTKENKPTSKGAKRASEKHKNRILRVKKWYEKGGTRKHNEFIVNIVKLEKAWKRTTEASWSYSGRKHKSLNYLWVMEPM